MDLEKKLTKARIALITRNPFFGALALRLKYELDESIETAASNGTSLRFNPTFVQQIAESHLEGVMAHLVLHLALLHHTRRGIRDVKKWNLACDYAIRKIIAQAGLVVPFELPPNPDFDLAVTGKSAEAIYSMLESEEEDNSSEGEPTQGNGDIEDSPSKNESAKKQEENEWKTAVAEAANAAKQTGKLPGILESTLGEMAAPVLPWKDLLLRFMTEQTNDEFTWNRGDRRFIAEDLYLPSRRNTDTGDIVIVIDTSGSLSQNELTKFGSEVQSIIDEVRPQKTVIIYCDSKIQHIDEYEFEEDIKLTIYGGGGTDFRPPFKHLEKIELAPKCLVYWG